MAIDETTRQRGEREDKMFKTKTLLEWVENLMLMVGEAYEVLDTDRAHFEEIERRLKELDTVKNTIKHNIYVDHVRGQQD